MLRNHRKPEVGNPAPEPASGALHPDLLTARQAAARMGVARLDRLPEQFRPLPLPYNERLYHRHVVDAAIERAAKQAAGKLALAS